MHLNTSLVKHSKNDIKRGIKIPTKLTPKLAHFLGIHWGDGHLRKNRYDYHMIYNGHLINEKDWYLLCLTPLIKELFNVDSILRRGHNSLELSFRSKAIHAFLNRVCGLPIGSKNESDIPAIIKKSNREIKTAFLLGLADTDLSLVFKKGAKKKSCYPVIDHHTNNPKAHLCESVFGL